MAATIFPSLIVSRKEMTSWFVSISDLRRCNTLSIKRVKLSKEQPPMMMRIRLQLELKSNGIFTFFCLRMYQKRGLSAMLVTQLCFCPLAPLSPFFGGSFPLLFSEFVSSLHFIEFCTHKHRL